MEALFERELPVLLRVGEREERYVDMHIFMYLEEIICHIGISE